jgi:hypothetical protein
VRNGPRRACAGRVVKRHFEHSPSRKRRLHTRNRVLEVSLRRRRGLLVAARSSPCGAARGNAMLAMNRGCGVRVARDKCG